MHWKSQRALLVWEILASRLFVRPVHRRDGRYVEERAKGEMCEGKQTCLCWTEVLCVGLCAGNFNYMAVTMNPSLQRREGGSERHNCLLRATHLTSQVAEVSPRSVCLQVCVPFIKLPLILEAIKNQHSLLCPCILFLSVPAWPFKWAGPLILCLAASTKKLASDNSGLPSNLPGYFCFVYYLLIWLLLSGTSDFWLWILHSTLLELIYWPLAPQSALALTCPVSRGMETRLQLHS